MKNLFKRTLSIILASMMLLCIGMIAGAETEETVEIIAEGSTETGIDWKLDSKGNLAISGEGKIFFERPPYIPWRSYLSQIKSITIAHTITNIGDYAFYGCEEIESIKIPSTVTRISKHAFKGCHKLTEIAIPQNVTYIDGNAFSGLKALETVEIYSGTTRIGTSAFAGCKSLKTLKLPKGITIDDYAFSGCDNLSTICFAGTKEDWVEIENQMTDIYEEIFFNADVIYNSPVSLYVEKITINTLPEKILYMYGEEIDLTGIELTAIWSDGKTETLTGSSELHVMSSDSNSFVLEYCDYYLRVPVTFKTEDELYPNGTFGNNLSWRYGVREKTLTISGSGGMGNFYNSYGNYAPWNEYSDAAESIVLEDGITNVGNYAFSGFGNVTSIEFPDSLESIGMFAFDNCEKIETLEIPDSVTFINKGAFARCHNLSSVKLPKNLKTIPNQCFYECESLKTVSFSSRVTKIFEYAFGDSNPIESIWFDGTVTDFSKINIGLHNNSLWNADIYFNGELHSHSYSSSVTTESTCIKAGVMTYTCECGKSYVEEIPAAGHQPKSVSVAATCTKEGIEYDSCEVCKNIIGEITYTPVVPHTAGEWENDESGYKVKKCTVCGTIVEQTEITVDEAPQPVESEVNYGDSIVLDSGITGTLPEGAYIVWTASNGNFDMEVSEDGKTCTVTSVEDGETTFTATVYDADGNVIEETSQTLTSNAGIFEIIADFFEKIFGFLLSLFK